MIHEKAVKNLIRHHIPKRTLPTLSWIYQSQKKWTKLGKNIYNSLENLKQSPSLPPWYPMPNKKQKNMTRKKRTESSAFWFADSKKAFVSPANVILPPNVILEAAIIHFWKENGKMFLKLQDGSDLYFDVRKLRRNSKTKKIVAKEYHPSKRSVAKNSINIWKIHIMTWARKQKFFSQSNKIWSNRAWWIS